MSERENKKPTPKHYWFEGIAIIVIAIALWAMATPVILRAKMKSPMPTAASNAKQGFYVLIEFDQDFGAFPGDDTAIVHPCVHGGEDLDLRPYRGNWSNDYLGQLIAGGYTTSEEIFYAKGRVHGRRKPDNVIDSADSILAPGECGFAYYKNASTSDHSGRPLLIAPMSGNGLKFDPKPYDGKIVVLRIDGAVKQLRIDKETGKALVGEGKTLFEGGYGTVWGNDFDAKNLVLPEPVR